VDPDIVMEWSEEKIAEYVAVCEIQYENFKSRTSPDVG
jgi:hypothetical protein